MWNNLPIFFSELFSPSDLAHRVTNIYQSLTEKKNLM